MSKIIEKNMIPYEFPNDVEFMDMLDSYADPDLREIFLDKKHYMNQYKCIYLSNVVPETLIALYTAGVFKEQAWKIYVDGLSDYIRNK